MGRAAELELLHQLRDDAARGHTRLAVVTGEPGVGKTRLLTAAAAEAHAEGWLILRGGAYELQVSSPFLPFVEALRAHLEGAGPGALRGLAPVWRHAMGSILPELGDDVAAPRAVAPDAAVLFEAWAQVWIQLAAAQPLALLLDDLQWADAACDQLLLYVRRRAPAARLFLLAAARDDELTAGHPLVPVLAELNRLRLSTPVPLVCLGPESTAHLLTGLLGGPPSTSLATLVHAESDGNPFFAEETVRGLLESERLIRRDNDWDVEAPARRPSTPSADDAVARRLERVSRPTRLVLEAAAILGRRFREEDLIGLVEHSVPAAVDDALARRLLREIEAGTLEFAHDRIREACHRAIEPERRAALHDLAAERLRRDSSPSDDAIAYHVLRGRHPERAIPHLVRASEQALRAGAPLVAAEHAGRAVALLRNASSPTDLADALVLLAAAHSAAGMYDEALGDLRDGLAAAVSPATRAEIHWRRGEVHAAREEPLEAEQALLAALDAAPPDREDLRQRVELRLGQLHVSVTGQGANGMAHLVAALDAARRTGTLAVEAEALAALGQGAAHAGDFETGRRRFAEAIEIADRVGDPGLSAVVGDGLARLLLWTARFADLRVEAERELVSARRTGNPLRSGWPTFWLTQALLNIGDWEGTVAQADELIRLGGQLGARRFLGQGHELRGIAALWQGDGVAACNDLRAATDHFRSIGAGALVYYLGPYAYALVQAGRLEDAAAVVDELRSIAGTFPRGSSQRVQAVNIATLVRLRLGTLDDPLTVLEELRHAERQFHWYPVARTLGLTALVAGRTADAERYASVAREVVASGGPGIHLGGVCLLEAAVARVRGRHAEADTLERRARGLLAARRIPMSVERLVPAGPSGPPMAHLLDLTPRELDVLRLIAQGRTNRDVADVLVISEKTVVNHVTHILGKLGVENRSGAVAIAIRHGIA